MEYLCGEAGSESRAESRDAVDWHEKHLGQRLGLTPRIVAQHSLTARSGKRIRQSAFDRTSGKLVDQRPADHSAVRPSIGRVLGRSAAAANSRYSAPSVLDASGFATCAGPLEAAMQQDRYRCGIRVAGVRDHFVHRIGPECVLDQCRHHFGGKALLASARDDRVADFYRAAARWADGQLAGTRAPSIDSRSRGARSSA